MANKQALQKACRDAGLEWHSRQGDSSFYYREDPAEWAEIHTGVTGAYCLTPDNDRGPEFGLYQLSTPEEVREYFSEPV